jgi:hypothetical protein
VGQEQVWTTSPQVQSVLGTGRLVSATVQVGAAASQPGKAPAPAKHTPAAATAAAQDPAATSGLGEAAATAPTALPWHWNGRASGAVTAQPDAVHAHTKQQPCTLLLQPCPALRTIWAVSYTMHGSMQYSPLPPYPSVVRLMCASPICTPLLGPIARWGRWTTTMMASQMCCASSPASPAAHPSTASSSCCRCGTP